MARILIRQAHGGQTRIISDVALPYFLNQGYVVLDDYDDAEDIPPVYLSRAEGDLRWASIADLGDPESAEVVVISEAVADILVDPATGPGADLSAAFETVINVLGYGADATGATDSAAAVQAAITAAVSTPEMAAGGSAVVAIPAGTYLWESANVAVPPNLPGTLVIRFAPGSRVNLTATAPRLFDAVPTANGDTFQNITIDGGGGPFGIGGAVIDAGDIGTVSGVGQDQHIIFGLRRPTSFPFVHWSSLLIRGFQGINCPGGPTVTRAWCGAGLYATETGTQYTMVGVTFEDMTCEGGSGGYSMTAGVADGSAYANAWFDDLNLIRLRHDTTVIPSEFWACSNIHLGQSGSGGRARIVDCEGYGSGDVGLELDRFELVTVDRSNFADAYVADYYLSSFSPVESTDRVSFRDCTAERKNITFPTPLASRLHYGRGWFIDHQNEYRAAPNVEFHDCRWNRTTAEAAGDGEAIYLSLRGGTTTVTIDGFDAQADNLILSHEAVSPQTAFSFVSVAVTEGDNDVTLKGRRLGLSWAGTKPGVGNLAPRFINSGLIQGIGTLVTRVELADVRYRLNVPPLAAGFFLDVRTGTIEYALKDVKALPGSSFTGLHSMVYCPPAAITVTGGVLRDCDLSAMGVYGTAWRYLRLDDTTQDAKLDLLGLVGVPTLSTKTGNYTVNRVTDRVVLANATTITITLPDATRVPLGHEVKIRNIHASGTCTVASLGGTIDGASTSTLAAGAARAFVSTGTAWFGV